MASDLVKRLFAAWAGSLVATVRPMLMFSATAGLWLFLAALIGYSVGVRREATRPKYEIVHYAMGNGDDTKHYVLVFDSTRGGFVSALDASDVARLAGASSGETVLPKRE